jgi:sugar phosphate isomerase/epimerase
LDQINNIRLKTAMNPDQIQNRLKYNPEIIEFHLEEEDLYQPEHIITNIQLLKSKGIRVYLHHPMKYKGQYLDIISSSREMRDFYNWSCELLAFICKQERIKCVIHCHYQYSESSNYTDLPKRREMSRRIEEILRICNESFLWEDTTRGIFSAQNPYLLSEIVKPLKLPLNIDISHSFIALHGDNAALEQHLEDYYHFAEYFHLVDSKGIVHDSLPLGKGSIDWRTVKSYVGDTDFIFEIDLKNSDYMDCTPMIESANYYNSIHVNDYCKVQRT